MEEIFTDKTSGAAFYEAANGLTINEMKNGKLFYTSSSDKYPKGYVSDEAAGILRNAKQAGKSFKEGIAMLTFANIHTDDGDVIPALIKTPEAPKVFWAD